MARGELQVLGQDVGAAQLAYQLHPLLSAETLALWSLSDGSLLLGPAAGYSLSDETAARVGVFLGLGEDEPTAEGFPSSEFGSVSALLYASFSLFF